MNAWTTPRRYWSDDRDQERNDNDLLVVMGDNGDWYISIVKHGERLGPAVRLTTSGTPHDCRAVPAAMAALYRALPPPEPPEPRGGKESKP